MSLDVKIRRNISFVGCILIVATTELNNILRLLFIALQWRRRCILSSILFNSYLVLHRALCSLFQPDTDGTCVSKCRQLSQETRGLDPMLFQYSRAIGGGGGGNIETAMGQILCLLGAHTGVCLHPPLPSIIFSPADQGTFSKTAGQSQAYYNT